MKYTIEDVKRLVPEASILDIPGEGVIHFILPSGQRYRTDSGDGKIFIITRRQLDIVIEALKEIEKSTSSTRLKRVSREALESIKKEGES